MLLNRPVITLSVCALFCLAAASAKDDSMVNVSSTIATQGSNRSDLVIHPLVDQEFERGREEIVAWVFLADKAVENQAAALRDLEQSYDARAIKRRKLRRIAPGLFDERDLPVTPQYVKQIAETGAELRIRSRWLNAVSVRANRAELEAIAMLPFVTKIQPVRHLALPEPHPFEGDRALSDDPSAPLGGFYGLSEAQLDQINVIAMHDAGYTGGGVIVGVLDTGFRRTHTAYNHPDHPVQIVTEWDFVRDDSNTAPEPGDPTNQHEHGTFILGALGAYQPGSLIGGCYDASFILAKVEDVLAEYPAEEDLFVAGIEFIEANGGDVATSSVVIFDHYTQDELDGMTSVMTVGYNVAAENGVHCFQGAGNDGHDNNPSTSHLLPPADAFLVNTCGAVDVNGVIAGFSSDGPTADGRLKPEVLARGVNTWTTNPNNDNSASSPSGTSLSTPLCATAAACLVQAHPDWTVSQMRQALYQMGDYYLANSEPDPLFVHGYGIIDALASSQTDPRRADLNGDFMVNASDLALLLGSWGPCEEGFCAADLNFDDIVDAADLAILLGDWS